ncbi:MAG: hypothetical protein PHV33_10160 [Elusimicrobiales bacterium]|nr:hypothetical protein [Elusimicrobiales bacterium]
MNRRTIAAVLIMIAGQTYAADFSSLQTFKAADLRTGEAAAIPMPEVSEKITGAQKSGVEIREAVIRISGYNEKEFKGEFLNVKELGDLAKQLNFLAGLPADQIPSELLGYLEGISISIQELLPKGPVGRNIGPALKAARALQAKVTSIGMPAKALRLSTEFAVGKVSLKIEPVNFDLAAVAASLACRFEDGSGSVGFRREKELAVSLTASGRAWRADISAGKLSMFSLFSSPKSCRYVLNVRSAAGVPGSVTLAGSTFNMTREELDGLLSDARLNEVISARNQPLRLVERNGFIVAAE